ncbi:site-specific integrase [Rhodococcus aetherivorans]|uniref:Site-specific integrase n=2 Tax=Rhodococcus aetherivorans TaxID=191292 RepID=A0AA46PSJ8_9NOCA|nr:site-specific integrase [Rhodococcus aetherivorans]UYF92441.1 site-specific integrase [Rhodococcus aetherivorans]
MPAKKGMRGWGRLRQLPSGRWQAGYVGPDGLLHRPNSTFGAKMDAEGWLAHERRRIDLGVWTPPDVEPEKEDAALTLAAYAEQWLAERNLKPRTRTLYRDLLRLHIVPVLGDAELSAITPATVRSWHAGLGTTTPTRNAHAYGLLHAIMSTAVDDELIDANPCRIRGASKTKRARTITLLTPPELDQLAAAMPDRLRCSVLLAAWCGLRWGETSELRRKDVSADRSVLHVHRAVVYRNGQFIVSTPKTSAGRRDVAVPPHIAKVLSEHLDAHVGRGKESLLFPAEAGSHMGDYEYRKAFKRAAAGIGRENLRVHDLRHVGAVLAAQAGATTAELMLRLGHTTPAMAIRYQHVAAGRDAQIAARLSELAGDSRHPLEM